LGRDLLSYSAAQIRRDVHADQERLFASWAVGRPVGWVCDQRTKDLVCLSLWLREEMTRLGLDELGRKTQEGVFHRYSRSDLDLFELAAGVMNDAVAGNIDRDRRTHRRWG